MVINTNLPAQSTARLLSESSASLAKSLARLSSGSKLVSPEDDAAGMAVSMRFDAQISRTNAARSNISNAVSFSQTQDGFLQKIGKALTRMSELTVLAQDATKTSADFALYDTEFQKLKAYISDATSKKFNGVDLFSGTPLTVTTDSEGGTTGLTNVAAGTYTGLAGSVDTAANAATTQATINTALNTLASDRANIGANISVLNSYNDQLGVLRDNITAANSRIRDVDVAEESATYAKYNILVQAGTSMLAQANSQPQSALKLLQ
jgi:flagellin